MPITVRYTALKTALIAAALLLFAMPLAAEEAPRQESSPLPEVRALADEVQKLIDYNASNNTKSGFSAHRSNYLLPFTTSDYDYDRENTEVKFQISIKQRFLRLYGWAWYIGYTQTSFWQAFNESDSRPFRENNFNPETFLRSRMWAGWRFDLGYEHESNGLSQPDSRSWNRLYLTPYFENAYFRFSLKAWYRIPEEDKDDPMDSHGDDNPDILDYYGYGELRLMVKIWDLYLSTMTRWNFEHGRGAFCGDATFPLYTSSMHWFVQYWEGYGESLIDYDINQRKIGFGFMFTR